MEQGECRRTDIVMVMIVRGGIEYRFGNRDVWMHDDDVDVDVDKNSMDSDVKLVMESQ